MSLFNKLKNHRFFPKRIRNSVDGDYLNNDYSKGLNDMHLLFSEFLKSVDSESSILGLLDNVDESDITGRDTKN